MDWWRSVPRDAVAAKAIGVSMTAVIETRYQQVMDEIALASEQAGSAAPQLLAVSKTKPIEMIAALAACGQRDFGENYLQEALGKQRSFAEQYPEFSPVWHYIGSIQSNKTRDIAANFDWVHTLEREKIAMRLNEQRPAACAPLNVCIQVNVSAEESKSGVAPEMLWALVESVVALPNLTLRGLMAIPAPDASADQVRLQADFAQMQALYHELQARVDTVDTLSMGMSGDLALAIAHGSTMVRVGTALFGARETR